MFPFTTLSVLRAGAPVLAGAAALTAIGATVLPAAASTAPQHIRHVSCTRATFTVYYGANRVACYEGTGELQVKLHEVHKITTGENSGIFSVTRGSARAVFSFTPREIVSFLVSPPTLTLIDITRT
jgi:hypothetical protein